MDNNIIFTGKCKSRQNYKYIYNVKIANFLLMNGIVCYGTGYNDKTNSYYWCFDRNECRELCDIWEERKNKN